jgi:hypothetical protein
MSRKTDLGIYLPSTKTFYYLEAGDNWIGNTVDRVRKALTQRNLIQIDFTSLQKQQNYTIMSIKDAELKDYSLSPIYISKHVEKLFSENKNSSGAFK